MYTYFRTSLAVLVAAGLALPAVASAAEIRAVTSAGVQVHVGGETGDMHASTSAQMQAQEGMGESNQQKGQGGQTTATGSAMMGEQEHGNATSTTAHERNQERASARLDLWLEATATPVQNAAQLHQAIQVREQELEQAASSSAASVRTALHNSVGMSVAVHAFLASKDMLGTNVGAQVSQVAQQLNSSLATTTQAQLQIAQRSFWTRLFFGGDNNAARKITEAVAESNAHITQLQHLLSQASVSADVKAQLTAQIQAMLQEQVHLAALAKQQASVWGVFSWRF